MKDEIKAKREEILEYVERFYLDDVQAEGIDSHPEVCREWLDGLFKLHAELRLLEDTLLIQRTSRTFTVEIKKGEPTGVKRQ
jgi:hypothetical protein